MFSHSITCAACGTVNEIVLEGDLLAGAEIHCSRCEAYLGVWHDMMSGAAADIRQTHARSAEAY